MSRLRAPFGAAPRRRGATTLLLHRRRLRIAAFRASRKLGVAGTSTWCDSRESARPVSGRGVAGSGGPPSIRTCRLRRAASKLTLRRRLGAPVHQLAKSGRQREGRREPLRSRRRRCPASSTACAAREAPPPSPSLRPVRLTHAWPARAGRARSRSRFDLEDLALPQPRPRSQPGTAPEKDAPQQAFESASQRRGAPHAPLRARARRQSADQPARWHVRSLGCELARRAV